MLLIPLRVSIAQPLATSHTDMDRGWRSQLENVLESADGAVTDGPPDDSTTASDRRGHTCLRTAKDSTKALESTWGDETGK